MRNARWMLFAALIVGACRGAERDRARPEARPAAVVIDAAPAEAMDAAPVEAAAMDDDPLAEKLRHCPLTVDGARADVRDIAGGIAIVVTGVDAAGAEEIRRRAAHLVALTSGTAHGVKHGGGEGGGFMRNCPAVVKDTRITAEDVAGGSRLTIVPTGALTVAELRTETRRRMDALANP